MAGCLSHILLVNRGNRRCKGTDLRKCCRVHCLHIANPLGVATPCCKIEGRGGGHRKARANRSDRRISSGLPWRSRSKGVIKTTEEKVPGRSVKSCIAAKM